MHAPADTGCRCWLLIHSSAHQGERKSTRFILGTRAAACSLAVCRMQEAHLRNLPLVGGAIAVQSECGFAISPVLVRQR